MDFIKSIKKLIFNENENKKEIINKNKKQNNNNEDYPIEYYKYLFKSNYKSKKHLYKSKNESFIKIINPKEQLNSNLKIKVNKCNKNDIINISSNIKGNKNEKILEKVALSPIKKNKLELDEKNNNSNISFFYILKGAVIIIEDWWKNILIQKNKNKIIIKRCINNKNHKIFSKKYIKKSHNNLIKNKKPLNIYSNIKTKPFNRNININNNIIDLEKNKKNNNIVFKSSNSMNINHKINIFENVENKKDSILEDTVVNFDSGFCEFNEKENKEKEKIKKIMKFDEEIRKRKIYSSDKINDNRKKMVKENNKDMEDVIETKRENSIIYPINEIEHVVIEDICKNLDNNLKKNIEKEKKIMDYYNLTKIKKTKNINPINNIIINDSIEKKYKVENGINKIDIPSWEDPNNNMTPFISIEQNRELFNEIKSKIKGDLKKMNDEYESEISIIQNKYLLRENPLNDSSIYIKNSELKQNEVIRNVNIHIVPTKTKDIIKLNNLKNKNKNKMLNNSNNSNTIIQLDDEYESFTNLIDISDCKNEGHTSSFFNSMNKNEDLDKNINIENEKKSKKEYILNKLSKKKFENIYKN